MLHHVGCALRVAQCATVPVACCALPHGVLHHIYSPLCLCDAATQPSRPSHCRPRADTCGDTAGESPPTSGSRTCKPIEISDHGAVVCFVFSQTVVRAVLSCAALGGTGRHWAGLSWAALGGTGRYSPVRHWAASCSGGTVSRAKSVRNPSTGSRECKTCAVALH